MNKIVRLAVKHRVFMLSLGLLIIAAGWFSFKKLPIDAVPDITNVQVQINTAAPGYSPLEVEQRITYPIETALYGLPGLHYSRSLSRYGLSQVTAVFDEGTDVLEARNLVNIRLAAINSELPPGLTPEMSPISTGLGEIFMYTVQADPNSTQANGKPWDNTALREVQDWIIKPQLAQVKGVIEVNGIGGHTKQYHVNPDPAKLLYYQLSIEQLSNALSDNNDNKGAGYIERNGQQLLVRSPGQLRNIEDIAQVIVTEHNSVPIRVGDIADIAVGKGLRSGAALLNGEETVLGTAMMLMGENSREVAIAIAEKLEALQSSLPAGVSATAVYDRTTLINKTIDTVRTNLLEGALLVIVILFLMLGNLRAALITAAIIPLAMLATICGMVQTRISANLMSLGALDFGLIVDGSIIIVENTLRRMAQAQQQGAMDIRRRAAIVYDATTEVIKPSLVGITIITVVYIPVFTLTGVEGKMFHPMAATVVMALLSAMLLSLTLVPAALVLFLNKPLKPHNNTVMQFSAAHYRSALSTVLKAPTLMLGVALLGFLASIAIASRLGSEFVPELNEGDFAVQSIRISGTGLEQSVAMQTHIDKRLANLPEVAHVFTRIGTAEVATDPMPPGIADGYVILKPRNKWPNPSKRYDTLLEEISAQVEEIPGSSYSFSQPIALRFNELISGVRSDLGIKIFGDDMTTLQELAAQTREVLENINGAHDIQIEQVSGLPTLSIIPNRTALGRYGLNVAQLQKWVASAIGGQTAGIIYQGDRRFELVVRLAQTIRTDIKQLKYLPVPLADGEYVPLGEVATLDISPGPAQISRENGKRRIVVSANVRNRDLGSFVNEAKNTIKGKIATPAGYWLEYGGTFEQLESATARLYVVVPLVLLLILALLTATFSSLKDALIIFSAVPLALCGGVFSLWFREMPLSISAAVGFIALSGIAVLNGLVMLSVIRSLAQQAIPIKQAILDGATMRLRPVLMTALVASLGFVPMAMNTGTGAEVQRPLATVVIGGLISATVLTLFVLPSLYYLVHGKRSQQ